MRIEQLVCCLRDAINDNVAAMIHGSPGCGKSDIVHQVSASLGRTVLDFRLSQVDSVDLRGVPSVIDGRTHWNIPDEFPREDAPPSILFLDEINSAPQSVQAAAYQLVLDRKLGQYRLPANCVPVAAGNRMTDRAIVNQMPTPLRNRFIHFDLESSIDDWCAWAITHGISEQTISFLRFRPTMLDNFSDTNASTKIKDMDAFCTPRSWATADKFVNSSNRLQMMGAAVGLGAAAEFEGFLRVYDSLQDLDKLLKKPETYKNPSEPATLYAMATGLASRIANNTPALPNFFKVMAQMPVEFATLAVKDAESRNPATTNSKDFVVWARANSAAIIG